jgi:hypothetical protein
MLVKLSGRVLSVLVLGWSSVNWRAASSWTAIGWRTSNRFASHHRLYRGRAERTPGSIWLAGFGAEVRTTGATLGEEWSVTVEALRSRFGAPGPNNAGLLGYLESVARVTKMAIRVPINLASEPFRRDRPILVALGAARRSQPAADLPGAPSFPSGARRPTFVSRSTGKRAAAHHRGAASQAERHAAQAENAEVLERSLFLNT